MAAETGLFLSKLFEAWMRQAAEGLTEADISDEDEWQRGEMPLPPGLMGGNFKTLMELIKSGVPAKNIVGPSGDTLLLKAMQTEISGGSNSLLKNLARNLSTPGADRPISRAILDTRDMKFIDKLTKTAFPGTSFSAAAERELAPTAGVEALQILEDILQGASGSTGRISPTALAVMGERLSHFMPD